MRDLSTTWFAPAHQPDEKSPVEFQVRPLDMPTFSAIATSMDDAGRPTWRGLAAAFEYSVVDWRGLPEAFSREAKRAALVRFDPNMYLWVVQICGELYKRAILTEAERKNS